MCEAAYIYDTIRTPRSKGKADGALNGYCHVKCGGLRIWSSFWKSGGTSRDVPGLEGFHSVIADRRCGYGGGLEQ